MSAAMVLSIRRSSLRSSSSIVIFEQAPTVLNHLRQLALCFQAVYSRQVYVEDQKSDLL
jgi:hypothetical protein